MLEYCIYLSFCLTTQLYWVPKGTKTVIMELQDSFIELYKSFMELHNSSYVAAQLVIELYKFLT